MKKSLWILEDEFESFVAASPVETNEDYNDEEFDEILFMELGQNFFSGLGMYLQYRELGTLPNNLPNQMWRWCWPEQNLSIAVIWSRGGLELWKLRFMLRLFQRIEEVSLKKHWRTKPRKKISWRKATGWKLILLIIFDCNFNDFVDFSTFWNQH